MENPDDLTANRPRSFPKNSAREFNALSQVEEMKLLDELFDELFPICRSITGHGLRETLGILARELPLETHGLPSGSNIFDWQVPPEWKITNAWLKGPDGRVYADFRQSNLTIVNYSSPVDRILSLEELRPHLHTIPDLPDAIPYVTSYYSKNWGFCLPFSIYQNLPKGRYHAFIESELFQGELNFADAILPGQTTEEILLSTYVCHPSLANNELSGPLVLLALYHRIARWSIRRFSYRFVFAPETIGSIAYLHEVGEHLRRTVHAGLVLTCLGGREHHLSYKLSRGGTSPLDQLVKHFFATGRMKGSIRPFDPTSGSDERQYCSPGFNLPVGQMARMVYGTYPGYHTSLDDKEGMTIEALQRSVDEIETILWSQELDGYYVNLKPYGEVKLDRYNLYPKINAHSTRELSTDVLADKRRQLDAILTLLNYADGQHSLVEIADQGGIQLMELFETAELLKSNGILSGPHTKPVPLKS